MVIGLKYGNADAKDRTVKQACDAKVAEFLRAFKTRHRSIVCRDLLGCDIFTPDGKQKALNEKLFTTLCADLVISAAAILEESGY
jgi:hypothetical protein